MSVRVVTCDECFHEFQVVESTKYATCPKCDDTFSVLNKKKSKKPKGLKDKVGKLMMGLIEPLFLKRLAGSLTYGAVKYKPNSWQNVEDPINCRIDSIFRHFNEYQEAIVTGDLSKRFDDEGQQLNHLDMMAANLMFLIKHDNDIYGDRRDKIPPREERLEERPKEEIEND